MKARLAEILGEGDPLTECRDRLREVSESLHSMKRLAHLLERYSPPAQAPSGVPLVDTGALAILLVNAVEGLTETTKGLLGVLEAHGAQPRE